MKNILKFRSDRRFKIVQFTDIHWHNGEPPDQQSAALMTQIAAVESPDLI
ncbi:metallophosphoesterase, partial [Candidatus Poribacteria bacterium]|nr:metallophosphoesterase [Candidatus Poribacteria bacterium]